MFKGVIFDMDGTITVPYIDWKSLRAKIGAVADKTLMQYIESLPPDRSAWANNVLLDAEREAAANAEINAGVHELIDHLRTKGMRLALVTNNHGEAMRTVLNRYGLRFDVALSRDDGEIKPSPALIHKALQALGLPPNEVVGIGDGRYDIESCGLAGVRCIYLTHGNPVLNHEPCAASLAEIIDLLQTDGFAK